MSSLDSEFNSASNGNTFIHRTYFLKKLYGFFSPVSKKNKDKGEKSSKACPVDKSITIRCRIKF
mgnify:FL=1